MDQTDQSPDADALQVRLPVVRDALATLGGQTVHKAYAGYIAILRAATLAQSLGPLTVSFKTFFDTYFAVAGSTARWPYYLPFGNAGDLSGRFFNRNVAGSYAPSSIRPVNPMRQLANIESSSSGVTFELFGDHGSTAASLLGGGTIPGASLAAFLYRDFAFELGSKPSDLYALFRLEFGFPFENGSIAFDEIFRDNTADLGLEVFEPVRDIQ